jgi:hypothetical protein
MTSGVCERSVLAAPVKPLDRLTEGGRRPGELAFPELVADHDDDFAAGDVVGRTNPTADLRLYAEHVVIVARNLVRKRALRVVADGRVHRRLVEGQQVAQHLVLRPQLLVNRVGEAGIRGRQQAQAGGMGNIEPLEQQRLGDGEDRRIGRDRQCERRGGDEREPGAPAQHAGAEDQIGRQYGRHPAKTLSENGA